MYAVVQPGVVTAKLAAAVEAKGLFYPPDPGSQAVSTLGGNVAENAGGLRGLKYGVTANYVMGAEILRRRKARSVKTGVPDRQVRHRLQSHRTDGGLRRAPWGFSPRSSSN